MSHAKDAKVKRSTEDTCIYILGSNGMTVKSPVDSSKALELISKACDKSISSAKGMFYRAVEKELFIKVDPSGSGFCFTKEGFDRYTTMRNQETKLEGANHTMEDLIKKFYWEAFIECVIDHRERIEIKYADIERWLGFETAEALRSKPDILNKMNEILKNIDLPVDDDFRPGISIVDIGKPYTLTVEEVRNSEYLGTMVEVEGRVMVQSEVRPRIIESAHRCMRCDHITYISQKPGKFIEPYECENEICSRKGPFELSIADSTQIDSQEIIIESAQGQIQLIVVLDRPLCTSALWERDAKFVRIVGVLNLREIYKQNTKEFNFVLDANSIKLSDDSFVEPPTESEIQLFETWAKDPAGLREKLVQSVAPHIHGKTDEKDALSLALFSDWTWNMKAVNALIRSSLHVLLIGDPGIAKSQLLSDIVKLAPKAIEGQGENSTGRGLSNAAVQVNGLWVIKAGLFAKADRGIVSLDELDKVDKEDLKTLNSILVSQRQIVDKAGQRVMFETRCAAVCGANPAGGHIDKYVPIINQLGVSSFLFQRFDLVFVMLDRPDRSEDGIIFDKVNEICNNSSVGDGALVRPIPADLYKKYVIYARSRPAPRINESATKVLRDFYLSVRNGRVRNDDYPAISARSAAALNKLTMAIARRELAAEATEEHAKYAISLYRKSIISMGLSGEEDLMVLENGGTRSQLQRIDVIRSVLKDRGNGCAYTLAEISSYTSFPQDEIAHTLAHLKHVGDVIEPTTGKYRWA